MLKSAIFIIATLTATGAIAADAPFNELSACRLADGQVTLRAVFDGGACDAVTGISVVRRASTAEVTIETQASGDICTMQIVPITSASTIELRDTITSVNVSAVLLPGNSVRARGSVDLAPCT